ncbi:MAG TPA: nickel-type superoxide dismutase maturation protease [Actinomycetota bacterium]|nr:nickel-type superoxide dismutase maturation protease [Actinomycetota bacterium]
MALVAAGVALARWRPFRIQVVGGSMRPALEPGEWAIAVRAAAAGPGDVVVVEHPERPGFELVKRLIDVAPGDELWVEGDARDGSTDSRTFGAVAPGQLVGRVVLVYHPWRRARLVGRR